DRRMRQSPSKGVAPRVAISAAGGALAWTRASRAASWLNLHYGLEDILGQALEIDLTPQEAMALFVISSSGGARGGAISEDDLGRLHLLGLVEQRGLSVGLTTTGRQTVARLRQQDSA